MENSSSEDDNNLKISTASYKILTFLSIARTGTSMLILRLNIKKNADLNNYLIHI